MSARFEELAWSETPAGALSYVSASVLLGYVAALVAVRVAERRR